VAFWVTVIQILAIMAIMGWYFPKSSFQVLLKMLYIYDKIECLSNWNQNKKKTRKKQQLRINVNNTVSKDNIYSYIIYERRNWVGYVCLCVFVCVCVWRWCLVMQGCVCVTTMNMSERLCSERSSSFLILISNIFKMQILI